jgi:hypothetical protein
MVRKCEKERADESSAAVDGGKVVAIQKKNLFFSSICTNRKNNYI